MKKSKHYIMLMLLMVLSMLIATNGFAERLIVETLEHQKIEIAMGNSITVKSPRVVSRISIGDPNIADYVLISPTQIYMTGKTPGKTNLTLWSGRRILAVYDVHVGYDVTRLKQRLHQLLPEEHDLHIMSADDSIILAGRISSTANLSQALSLAEGFAPKEKVRNLVEVAGVHEVMLEVRVAEMSKNLTRRLGFNFSYVLGSEFAVGLLNRLTDLETGGGEGTVAIGPLAGVVSPNASALLRFNNGNATWTAVVDALKDDGLIKVLAEPTLIALSGQTAEFLAGGEYPVPVPQGLGTVAIEYKQYGVSLAFTPTVINDKKINIRVSPEVSQLDFTTGVVQQGFVIPSLNTRRASTIVELGDGQSFAIAGLLSEQTRDTAAKYPGLGDLPILGQLFRSSSFQKSETELVIIVTPHLVKPLDMAKQPLPTDYYIEPSDIEFYLFGMMEGKHDVNKSSGLKGRLDGSFGHAIPLTN